MSRAILFGGANSIDNEIIRRSVVRIPEVSLRIRQAQKVVDELGIVMDLHNLLSADDASFGRYLDYRGLLSSVIQVGLYDRYLRLSPESDYFISESNGQLAAEVCSHISSIQDVIEKRLKANEEAEEAQGPALGGAVPLLTKGVTNQGYTLFEKNEDSEGFNTNSLDIFDLGEALEVLNERYGIDELVIIGPGDTITESISQHLVRDRIRMSESIELDPLLTWFWSEIRRANVAIA